MHLAPGPPRGILALQWLVSLLLCLWKILLQCSRGAGSGRVAVTLGLCLKILDAGLKFWTLKVTIR